MLHLRRVLNLVLLLFVLARINKLIAAVACAGMYVGKLYFFNLFPDELQQAILGGFEQLMFDV